MLPTGCSCEHCFSAFLHSYCKSMVLLHWANCRLLQDFPELRHSNKCQYAVHMANLDLRETANEALLHCTDRASVCTFLCEYREPLENIQTHSMLRRCRVIIREGVQLLPWGCEAIARWIARCAGTWSLQNFQPHSVQVGKYRHTVALAYITRQSK